MRKTVANKLQQYDKDFRFRGHEVKSIEAFSDAVFGFAVTLLIVSLEVPKSFEELLITMRGFFAFSVSFLLLMLIWTEQNMFFRRFALDDKTIIFLNSLLIFIVLFYVYPLKFLFALLFSSIGTEIEIKQSQIPELMFIYGAGYVSIYLIFFFMYLHASRKKEDLELTDKELFHTKTRMWAQLILVFVGLLSVVTALLLPPERAGLAGFIYFIIGPAFTIYYTIRKKQKRRLFDKAEV